MITEWGFDTLLSRKCNLLGKAFEQSIKDGYDSMSFVKQVMTDKKYDWLFAIDDCQEWCDEMFLYDTIRRQLTCEKGTTEEEYLLWFAGYLYKYWMNTRNIDRKTIYKILPLQKLKRGFNFYHTQGWDYIIEDVSKNR